MQTPECYDGSTTSKATELIRTGSLVKGLSAIDILDYSARTIFGITPSFEIRRIWTAIVPAITHLDAIVDGDYGLDSNSFDPKDLYSYWLDNTPEVPAGINLHSADSFVELKTALDALPDSHQPRRTLVQNIENFIVTSEEAKQAKTVEELAEKRMIEGRLLARLFTCLVPHQDRGERFDEFSNWLAKIVGCSELVDSIIDMPLDSTNRRISIDGNLRNRAALLRYSFKGLGYLAKHSSPGLIVRLGMKTILVGVNRIGRFNKYRNG